MFIVQILGGVSEVIGVSFHSDEFGFLLSLRGSSVVATVKVICSAHCLTTQCGLIDGAFYMRTYSGKLDSCNSL